MTAINRLQGLLLCGALAAFVGIAQAQTMPEDATTKMDEAAQAEADKAAAAAEKKAEEMQKDADTQMEEIRGPSMQEEMTEGDEHSD